MKLTRKELNQIFELQSRKYLSLNEHPLFPNLKIATYTSKAEIDEIWDDFPIIRRCRGLVFDELNGRIVINCIPKFFNIDTKFAEKIDINDPATVITEKNDGYLIQICFDTRYGLIVTSKSSFTSQYAMYVFNKVKKEVDFVPNMAYICELCKDFPGDEGIIVTKHPKEKIVCFAIRNDKGEEEFIENSYLVPQILEPVRVFTTFQAQEYFKGEVEGIVLYNHGKRVKIKTEWFFKIHKLISECTQKHVFELFSQGIRIESIADSIPDEFLIQMLSWQDEFDNMYKALAGKIASLDEETKHLTDKELALSDTPYKNLLFIRRKKPAQLHKALIKEMKNGQTC